MTVYDGYYSNTSDFGKTPTPIAQEPSEVREVTTLSPAIRVFCAVGLAAIGFSVLAVFGEVSVEFTTATPSISDLEDWLVWGDVRRF
jgi:hypothetical protein